MPATLTERLAALEPAGQHGEEAVNSLIAAGAPHRVLELGDPGIVYDSTTSRADLPAYQGPPEPVAPEVRDRHFE